MEISEEHYNAIEKAYAESATAVHWAYRHWAFDVEIESALIGTMGADVSKAVVGLLGAVETLLKDVNGLPVPKLALSGEQHDPDNY